MYWITRSAGVKEIPYLWDAAAKITAPTLIMKGAASPFISDDLSRRMCAAIKRAEVATFDTGHYIPREAPEEFCDAIRSFIGRAMVPAAHADS
jgi:pimeloyl-ACP methyl ester carboxylesterase